MFIFNYFKNSNEVKKFSEIREFKTVDIVKRLGVLSPNRVHLKNYPINNPISIFNPAIKVERDHVKVYGRIILGYFMYVSAIVEMEIPIDDILSGAINIGHYPAQIVICPSTKYDIWGTEDPRICSINGRDVIIYTGRTINYFNPAIRKYRTAPVAAINLDNKWYKFAVFSFPQTVKDHVISDKDAFLLKTSDGKLYLFHRPHMDDENYYLVVSSLPINELPNEVSELKIIEVRNTTLAMEPANFELKLGWAVPPIQIKDNVYLTLIHGVDNYIEGYRVFAALLEYIKDEGIKVTAVTPYYIMEPRMTYEVFGDRPFTIFPCGMCLVDKDTLLISYGAADYVIGFGEVSLSELLSHLEKGKVE